jgi:LysM repeat protein
MTNLTRTAGILPILFSVITLGQSAEPTLSQEVHELRRDIQLQTAKITSLTEQISALTHALQEKPSPEPVTPPTANPLTTPVVGSNPVVTIPTQQKSLTEAKITDAAIPRAEAVSPLGQHLVEKGDTLTSIAKRYNIPLSDLQVLNKGVNDRKLQIGQILKVPAIKPTDSPANKPET